MDSNCSFMCCSSTVSLIFRGYAVPFKSVLCFCYPMAYLSLVWLSPVKFSKLLVCCIMLNLHMCRLSLNSDVHMSLNKMAFWTPSFLQYPGNSALLWGSFLIVLWPERALVLLCRICPMTMSESRAKRQENKEKSNGNLSCPLKTIAPLVREDFLVSTQPLCCSSSIGLSGCKSRKNE